MKPLYFVPALAVLGLSLPVYADSEQDVLQAWIDYVAEYRQYMEDYKQWASNVFEIYKNAIAERDNQINAKDARIHELESLMDSKDNTDNQNLQDQLDAKDARIQNLQDQLNSKDATIQALESSIDAKDATSNTILQDTLDENDSRIQEKDARIQELESSIDENDSRIQEKDATIRTLESSIDAKDATIQRLQDALKTRYQHIQPEDHTQTEATIPTVTSAVLHVPNDSLILGFDRTVDASTYQVPDFALVNLNPSAGGWFESSWWNDIPTAIQLDPDRLIVMMDVSWYNSESFKANEVREYEKIYIDYDGDRDMDMRTDEDLNMLLDLTVYT